MGDDERQGWWDSERRKAVGWTLVAILIYVFALWVFASLIKGAASMSSGF